MVHQVTNVFHGSFVHVLNNIWLTPVTSYKNYVLQRHVLVNTAQVAMYPTNLKGSLKGFELN